MKFYNSIGPNPQVVRMFAAEKGITLDMEQVDLLKGENRQAAHLRRNPAGQTPALELDNGTYVSEITAICEYLEEKHPSPALIGATPEERAETRMWVRRIDLNIIEPGANGFRFAEGLKLFQPRIHVIPQAADDLKAIAREKLAWLNGLMAGRDFVCGTRVTLADILLYCFVEFFAAVGQPLDPANANIAAHTARMKARPSSAA